jgi:hypothetical protein
MTATADFEKWCARPGSGRARLVAFLRDVRDEEWTWSPEDGAPSAARVAAALLDEERSLRERFVPEEARPSRSKHGARPPENAAAAIRALEASRALTWSAVRDAGAERRQDVEELALRLAFADGAAFGEIALLLRLIDPLRAAPALV